MTSWRWLRDRREAGVWEALHQTVLGRLGAAGQINWIQASVDAACIPAKEGRIHWDDPTERGKPGSKRHLIVDRAGIPFVICLKGSMSTTA